MKKWIVIVVLAAVGGLWVAKKWPEWKPKNLTPVVASNRPTTAEVTTRNIDFTVMAAGDVGPAEQVSVRPEINGRIRELPVDIGDHVKKGDILFTLDDSDLKIELSSRLTEIEGAKLQLDKAGRNYKRSQELFEEQLISKELFEDSKTEFELAKNSLERSQRNLDQVQERLSKTKIMAPFDCTVLTRPVSVGQAVSGSGGFNSGTEVLTIADLNNLIVNAHVNQADVIRLTTGQQVDIQVESVPGLTLKGTVERVAPQSTLKNSVKGYAARILINKETIDPRVRPGMTANLTIPVASAENAVAVPLAAVFSEQGQRYVLVKKGDTFEKRPVQIGIADYDYAEVQGGLSPGDVVSLEDNSSRGGQKPGPGPGQRPGTNSGTLAGPRTSAAPRPDNRSTTKTPPAADRPSTSSQTASTSSDSGPSNSQTPASNPASGNSPAPSTSNATR